VHTEATSDATISLDCTVAETSALEPIQKSAYLRLNEFSVEDPDWDVGIEEMFALPYYPSVDGMGVEMRAIDPDPCRAQLRPGAEGRSGDPPRERRDLVER